MPISFDCYYGVLVNMNMRHNIFVTLGWSFKTFQTIAFVTKVIMLYFFRYWGYCIQFTSLHIICLCTFVWLCTFFPLRHFIFVQKCLSA